MSTPMALNNWGSYEVPMFGYATLDDATEVAFNDGNLLGIPEYGAYDKWYICDINGGGDLASTYPSVVWNLGDAAPQLASCLKVDIIRVFA